MKMTSIACVAALAAVLAGPVLADDRDDRRGYISPHHENWLSIREVAIKLEQQGYHLREIERYDGL